MRYTRCSTHAMDLEGITANVQGRISSWTSQPTSYLCLPTLKIEKPHRNTGRVPDWS